MWRLCVQVDETGTRAYSMAKLSEERGRGQVSNVRVHRHHRVVMICTGQDVFLGAFALEAGLQGHGITVPFGEFFARNRPEIVFVGGWCRIGANNALAYL